MNGLRKYRIGFFGIVLQDIKQKSAPESTLFAKEMAID